MNEIELKAQKNNANKVATIFVIKLLFFYILFSQGNLFMNSVFSPGARFYNEFLAQNFNYIQWLRSALILSGSTIINLFGFHTVSNASDIMIVKGPYLIINYSCIGLGVMSFLSAFVIAFPAKLKEKTKLFFIGMLMIFVLNVLRIAGLGVLLGFFEHQSRNFAYHHEIFNIIVYLCILALLYFWIKKNTKNNKLFSSTIEK